MTFSKEIMSRVVKELYREFLETRNFNSFLNKIEEENVRCSASDNFGVNLILLQTYFQLYIDAARNNDRRTFEKYHYILIVQNFVDYIFDIANRTYEKDTLDKLFGSKRNLIKRIENIHKIFYNKNLI